eukprot:scaffold175893_cov28-Tisochrysis_lutea.AAC.3
MGRVNGTACICDGGKRLEGLGYRHESTGPLHVRLGWKVHGHNGPNSGTHTPGVQVKDGEHSDRALLQISKLGPLGLRLALRREHYDFKAALCPFQAVCALAH